MIQLNLLPDVKKEFLRAQSARRKTIAVSILITIIAVGLTVVFAIYVYAVQNVILFAQTEDIKSKSKELSEVKDLDKYLTIQQQLSQLSALHNQKNDFSRLLTFLPSINPAPPKNMILTNLDVNASETTVIFKGRVADYGALTTLKDTLLNAEFTYNKDGEVQPAAKLFKEVNIDAAVYEKTESTDGVNFTITVKYDPVVFLQESQAVNITIPNIETTSSVTGSPQAIFEGNN